MKKRRLIINVQYDSPTRSLVRPVLKFDIDGQWRRPRFRRVGAQNGILQAWLPLVLIEVHTRARLRFRS